MTATQAAGPATPILRRSERGAILVQLAVSLSVICGFCALAIDFGVLWTAKAQAQNAADAGALAGATALAFDTVINSSIPEAAAFGVAQSNAVWGEAPIVEAETIMDASCAIPGAPPPPIRIYTCVRVNVYRNQEMGNPLPTLFSHVFDITEQGVRAQAIGTAVPANSTSCVWPIALPDKWQEFHPVETGWQPTSTYVRFDPYPTPVATPDIYTAPSTSTPGSGFSLAVALLNTNQALTLTMADPLLPIRGNQFVPVTIPRIDGGGFLENLESCNGTPMYIGMVQDRTAGTMANVRAAAADRIAQDPAATWNTGTLRIQNSCSGDTPPCAALSPRLVAVPLFDVDRYEETRLAGGNPEIEIVNFVGLFIRDVTATELLVNFSTFPGQVDVGKPAVMYQSSFLRAPALYR